MSTKINSRSPFYITATEPTAVEGAFSCTTAGLANFSVESDGTIINPTILKGTIIAQDHIEFPSLGTTDSATPRTVNYTIQIPDNFTNTTDGTLICPQTFTQLPPTTCVASTNNNMAVFAGTISNLTNVSTGSTVSLGSFFSNGTSATITSYEVLNYQGVAIDAVLTGTVPNQTLTFSTSSSCVSGTFKVRARNSVDACITDSNDFTVASACTKSLHCTTQDATTDSVALTGGAVSSTGVVSIPVYSVGNLTRVNIKTIAGVSNTTDITSDVSVGNAVSALNNTTGSSRTIVLTFRFEVPSGYTNSGAFLDCDDTFTQPATTTPELVCTDDIISYHGFRITTNGGIEKGRVDVNGVTAALLRTTTDQSDGLGGFKSSFDTVTTAQPRNIKVTFLVPSGFSNTGDALTCDVSGSTQPPISNPCDITHPNFLLSVDSFNAKNGFCDRAQPYVINNSVTINSSDTSESSIVEGNIVCHNGSTLKGFNQYFAVSATGGRAGKRTGTFIVIRIDENGVITDIDRKVNCDSDVGKDNIL